MSTTPRGLQAVPQWLHEAQAALLRALDALGLVSHVDGQPAWPWAQRLAVETLAIDAALTRQVVTAAGALALALLLLVIAWRWRRARGALIGAAFALVVVTPWPALALLVQPAVPSSFHTAPATLPAAQIAEGHTLYRQHCAQCHGEDGRGETPHAAQLPVWPPRLTGALLWRRADGETYWRLRHGLRARDGRETMPAHADVLTPAQTWAVIAALRLMASGESLKTEGRWAYPIAAPGFTLRCGDGRERPLSVLRGQRVRLVVAGEREPAPRPDPRFETVLLRAGPVEADDCAVADTAAARSLIALVAGTTALDGVQLLIDREGWLRAIGRPGEAGWRAEDLVCRTDTPITSTQGEDPIDTLIRRMDAEPVPRGRWLRHGR